MSPISATRTAPRVGPMPGIFWTAVYPGSCAILPRMMPANTVISKSTSSSNRRSEAILAAYGAGSSSPSNNSVPHTPNRSLISTWTPHLASTACTSALQCERNPTSLARCRTNSRSSRVGGGPVHHRRQPLHVIDDPHRLQDLTTGSGPDDHRPPSVQIDSHELLSCIRFHIGASSPSRTRLGHSQASRWEAPLEREEAPLLHRIRGLQPPGKTPGPQRSWVPQPGQPTPSHTVGMYPQISAGLSRENHNARLSSKSPHT